MKKIKFLFILFWNKCTFLHYDRKLLPKLSKCNFLNASGICNFYTCKKLLYWKQSSIVRHFCPTSPMDPIFHIWAVVTCTKAWGKNQGDKWLFTNCQKNEPNLMLGLLSIPGFIYVVCSRQFHQEHGMERKVTLCIHYTNFVWFVSFDRYYSPSSRYWKTIEENK